MLQLAQINYVLLLLLIVLRPLAFDVANELKVFFDCQEVVQNVLLRAETQVRPNFLDVFVQIPIIDHDFSLSLLDDTRQHGYYCRLSGSVVAEQAEYLLFVEAHGYLVDSQHRSERLFQIDDLHGLP